MKKYKALQEWLTKKTTEMRLNSKCCSVCCNLWDTVTCDYPFDPPRYEARAWDQAEGTRSWNKKYLSIDNEFYF